MTAATERHPTAQLNGEFGVCIQEVTRSDLTDSCFQNKAYNLWMKHGGLLAIRGDDLHTISPKELTAWAEVFGVVDCEIPVSRQDKVVPGFPILRIGNIKDEDSGKPLAQFSVVPPLGTDADIRYNPVTRRPVWHTDGTFRKNPPTGSVFQCRRAPPVGGETLFADTTGAYAALDGALQQKLETLEAVCSLAHHDCKIHSYSPDYPTLTPAQRSANPPARVPVVLHHLVTLRPALYGLNSSTCAIVPAGKEISPTDLDTWDLQGVEDESVQIWRDLLPFVTSPDFTVKWQWKPGDIVVWDNRCTIHSATGFDYHSFTREMWRLTLLSDKVVC